ncbi:hypothetical protein BpHYR1_016794 [Brachionus plicatilis]|uniref:Uncharacterized protein n=1 Tax=Brachionus plicatilis TaxID=10195 RepID=A0A3M7RLF3_BRAPC|nr:hypothetical protein BpHYR1_016794 [Brachionus plicatilis]
MSKRSCQPTRQQKLKKLKKEILWNALKCEKKNYSGSNKIVTPLGRQARPRLFCRPGAAFQRRRRGLPSRPIDTLNV